MNSNDDLFVAFSNPVAFNHLNTPTLMNGSNLKRKYDENQSQLYNLSSSTTPIDVPSHRGRELPVAAGGSNSSSGQNGNNSSAKSQKKRFVWPDELHKDFISAVFAYGLHHTNTAEIITLVPSLDGKVTDSQIRSQIQRFLLYQQQNKSYHVSSLHLPSNDGDDNPYENDALDDTFADDMNGQVKSLGKNIFVEDAEKQRYHAMEMISTLRRRIDNLSQTIQIQNNFISSLKSSVSKQTKIYSQLVQKLNILDPQSITEAIPSGSLSFPIETGYSNVNSNQIFEYEDYNKKSENQIVNEMRSLSGFHQQLSQYRQEQQTGFPLASSESAHEYQQQQQQQNSSTIENHPVHQHQHQQPPRQSSSEPSGHEETVVAWPEGPDGLELDATDVELFQFLFDQ